MSSSSKDRVVILVTDPRYPLERTTEVIRAAARALGPGGLAVQLRDKESPLDVLTKTAHALRRITADERALLVINGPLAVAVETGANGVHFPSGQPANVAEARKALGQDAFVTMAAHDDDGVRRAALAGASAVLVSPIFATPGKGSPRGTAAIASARAILDAAAVDAPRVLVHALGGVDVEGAADCARAGANGVAVIRALLDAADPGRVARDLAAPYAPVTAASGRG